MTNVAQKLDQSPPKNDEEELKITATEFLDTIFADIENDEHVCVSRATPKQDEDGMWWSNYLETSRQWRKWKPDAHAQAWYFNCCTVNGELNDKGDKISRGRVNLMRYYVLVLDDIGQKTDAPPVEPTYKLESSAGSFQWGYALEPGDDLDRFEALIETIHQKGWGDKGAGGSYRVMRVPGSANLKPGRQEFRSHITYWEPDRYWTLDELAAAFGVDMDTVVVKDTTINTKLGGAAAMEGIDPMLDWLVDAGHVVADKGAWVDVVCPWADSHTSGANISGYSPLGRGGRKWVQTRSWKCQHEHCQDKHLSDFRKWAVENGGPEVSGFDPLPWFQDKFAYVVLGQIIIDLHQRKIGGEWTYPVTDWAKDHPGKMSVPGHERPIPIPKAFIEHCDTKKAVALKYQPVTRDHDTGIIELFGQQYVNTYVPPNWPETDEKPRVFLEHMDYLFPNSDEREVFLDWLAYKIQKPASRSYAIVMVAENAYGTGRSWIKDMLTEVLQGGVNSATLAQLYGKGTSSEQTYNDWKVGCQFIVIEEAKDSGLSHDDYYHGYETFKLNVDTKIEKNIRVNEKYGRTRHEHGYYNVMIFSNHADAMVIPENDRRVCVLENPSKRLDYDYYDRLINALRGDEPARVYWWLMRRDVSGFDHVYPQPTPTKARMVENTRAPSAAIAEWILENHPSDIVTRNTLRSAVMTAARELDDEKNMMKPQNITKILWREIKTLRAEDTKHGARYMIGGKRVEVRAIRNREEWLVTDSNRDEDVVKAEMKKTNEPEKLMPTVQNVSNLP